MTRISFKLLFKYIQVYTYIIQVYTRILFPYFVKGP